MAALPRRCKPVFSFLSFPANEYRRRKMMFRYFVYPVLPCTRSFLFLFLSSFLSFDDYLHVQ